MGRSLKILVVDSEPAVSVGGSLLRGFRQLGHDARFFDQTPWIGGYVRRFPAERYVRAATRPFAIPALNVALLGRVFALRPDLVLVLKGAHVLPETLASMRRVVRALAVYSPDDYENPLNTNDRMRRAIPEWDAIFTPRSFAVDELRAAGARRVTWLPFGYDPTLHHPAPRGRLANEVAHAATFVGTRAPERTALLVRLAKAGVAVRVFGDGWDVEPALADARGPSIYGAAVREVFGHAGVNLAFLRKANRDLHQMRTFEVPACGGLLLTERTVDHVGWFDEGREALFFETADELVEQARWALAHPDEARRIADAGHRRVRADHHGYRDRAAQILAELGEVLA